MNLLVILEQRFHRTPDGTVWTDSVFSASFWQRYLTVFDELRVAARIADVSRPPATAFPAGGPAIRFHAIPDYLGPRQYLLRWARVRRAVRGAFEPGRAVILRVASPLGAHLRPITRRLHYPYGVEVVGDPHEFFAPGSVRHPLRPLIRSWLTRQLRRACAEACAAAYVTRDALQRRYPASAGALSTHYSSVHLPDAALASAARTFADAPRRCRLLFAGSLAQLYKAPDAVIEATASCVERGLDLRLRVAGDGRHRAELEELAARRGIAERVRFLGQLPGSAAVRDELDRADLFVLPSRSEGLPRALIEAMARALPCIGSTAGGIPELLADEDLVPPGDAVRLADKLCEVLADSARLHAMSARNLATAREYAEALLDQRRQAFYRHVRDRTRAWRDGRAA